MRFYADCPLCRRRLTAESRFALALATAAHGELCARRELKAAHERAIDQAQGKLW